MSAGPSELVVPDVQFAFQVGSQRRETYPPEYRPTPGLTADGPRRVAAGSAAENFVVSGLFYNLGRQLGRAAVPVIRKTRWIYDGLAGDEEASLRAENELGRTLAAEVRAATPRGHDPAIAVLVNELGQRLRRPLRDQRREFHCEVIGGESPNAMALPGGFIFVSRSLVEWCERQPDELAFVIGHEMAHIIRRHAWDRMVNQTVLRAASVVTARAGVLGGWVRQNGLGLLRSAHDRTRELEADELGLRLASAAGFDPGGAIALLRRIDRLGTDPGLLGQYFASHPPAAERMARLRPMTRSPGGAAPDPGTAGGGKKSNSP